MPVEFLGKDQVVGYGAFAEAPSQEDLERFFFLDDEDRRLVNRCRREHNRLGFGVQVGTVRMLGRFLDEPMAVPNVVVDYVADQLGIEDPACAGTYGERSKTTLEHEWEIRRAYNYREFAAAQNELSIWLEARAWTTGVGPKALFDATVEWLLKRKVLLPGVTTLTRFVVRVREQATHRLWEFLFKQVSDGQKRQLAELLAVESGERTSSFERLRKGPVRASGTEMKRALIRVAEIRELGFSDLDLAVPPRRLLELARRGHASSVSQLRRLPDQRRYATLLATVRHLHTRALDDALDLFDVLMGTKLIARVGRETRSERIRTFPKLVEASSKLASAVRTLLSADCEASVGDVLKQIEASVASSDLGAALSAVESLTPAADSDLDEEWRTKLVERYRTVRPFLSLLTSEISFTATAEGAPVLSAMRDLPSLIGRKKVTQESIDMELLVGSWRRLVLSAPHLEPGTVDWRAYVFCVLEQFWRHLARRDIHAVDSSRWGDPRAKLLSGSIWEEEKATILASLDLPENSTQHLKDKVLLLDETYRDAASRFDENDDIRVDDAGRLHFGALTASPESSSLRTLRQAVEQMLPRVELPELATWTGYHEAFTPLGGGRSRLENQELSIAALLTAQACNIGLSPVVKSCVPALTRDRLSHVDQMYMRAETLTAANRALIAAQRSIPLASSWGGGLVASIDGMRFKVPVPTIHAKPNPRYFGRGVGATWLNMLNDQASGLSGKVVAGTPRDSLHVLDVLHEQDAGIRPQMIVTDTASYSDVVFGILSLAGHQYAPQLAHLPDQKLWRVDGSADYGPFNTAARGRINVEKVERHWPDILRIIGSIHTGTVCSHDVIRMLQRGGRPTPLGDAIAHYGRIHKSLHVLRLTGDQRYRRQIKVQANLQEGRHALARRVFYGDYGELRQRYREGMEDQIGALGLVLNMIVLFNTRYMNAALEELRAEGHPVLDEDVTRLSPFARSHINMQGRYAFLLPELGGELRKLGGASR